MNDDRIGFSDGGGAEIVSEYVSAQDVYGVAPERVDHADVATAQQLWEAMRGEFDPHDGWTFAEIGPLLRTFTAVLTRRRAELCPPVGEERVDVVARLLAAQDGDPFAEDWSGRVRLKMPLARRVHEEYAPQLRRLAEALRARNKEYGRASAEIGAQRGMIARALEQRRVAVQHAERVHAEIIAARSRVRMLLGVQDQVDLGALTLIELIGRLFDHLGRPAPGAAAERADEHLVPAPGFGVSNRDYIAPEDEPAYEVEQRRIAAGAAGHAVFEPGDRPPAGNDARVLVDGALWQLVGYSHLYGNTTWRPVFELPPVAERPWLWDDLVDGHVVIAVPPSSAVQGGGVRG